jgi:hypothetical protein
MAVSKNFKNIKGGITIGHRRCCFKEINSRWNYVSDPKILII